MFTLMRSNPIQKFKISFTGYSRRTQVIPDNEHRNVRIHGNDDRACYALLYVYQMIAALPIKCKSSFKFKNLLQCRIVYRRQFRHIGATLHRVQTRAILARSIALRVLPTDIRLL